MRVGLRTKVVVALAVLILALTGSALGLMRRGQAGMAEAVAERAQIANARTAGVAAAGFTTVRQELLAGSRAGLQVKAETRAQLLAELAKTPILTMATDTLDEYCALVGRDPDVVVACGVESMSRVPIGSNSSKKLGLGVPIPKSYFAEYEITSQFEGAERIAERWGVTRDDTDAFALRSQQLAAQAWDQDRFAGQVLPIDAPVLGEDGEPTGDVQQIRLKGGLNPDTGMVGSQVFKFR